MRKKAIILLSLVILLSLSGYAGTEHRSKTAGTEIKGKKEVLVARDIGKGDEASGYMWCGKTGLLYKTEAIGTELIDIITKKKVLISKNPLDRFLNCTPDGRWVLYTDYSSLREDPAYEYEEGAFFGWMGMVLDIYRYDVVTEKTERIAIVRGDVPAEAISPDGKKIFLGARHSFSGEVTVPEWEGLWLTNEWSEWSKWDIGEPKWFTDSSGVVLKRYYPNGICVEIFGEHGWARCFDLVRQYRDDIYGFTVDRENRFYFIQNEQTDRVYQSRSRHTLYRCNISRNEIFCEKILERNRKISYNYGFLPDGSIVFHDGRNCIRRAFPGQADAECMVGSRYENKVYDSVSFIGISPNGRWLVFERSNMITKSDGKFSHWENDLFAIDLMDE